MGYKTFLKYTTGNTKLNKIEGTVGLGLPAYRSADGFVVCKNAGACASLCYARAGMYLMRNVREAREFNLAILRKSIPDFTAKVMADLRAMSWVKVFRWHDSGDVLNNEHLQALYSIARAFPKIRFYMYTKMMDLPLYVNKPRNFSVTQSMGGLLDRLIDVRKAHARIFSTHYARKKAGYKDGTKTDRLALEGNIRTGLVYHGVKKLTPAQSKYLAHGSMRLARLELNGKNTGAGDSSLVFFPFKA